MENSFKINCSKVRSTLKSLLLKHNFCAALKKINHIGFSNYETDDVINRLAFLSIYLSARSKSTDRYKRISYLNSLKYINYYINSFYSKAIHK